MGNDCCRASWFKLVNPLVVVETHPVQYHAPVYRILQEQFQIPVKAIYGSDFSIIGYHDIGFNRTFAWDTDLTSGYTALFLSRSTEGGARSMAEVSSAGLTAALKVVDPAAVLLVGYYPRFYQEAFWHIWRAGYPLLFRAETTDHAGGRSLFKRLGRDVMLRWFYRRCSALLYIGHRSYQHYQRLLNESTSLFFSPYCVDTESFRATETDRVALRAVTRQSLDVREHERAILFAGKLVSKKAPELLLKAVKQLPLEERKRTIVLFLGDGPRRVHLRHMADEAPRVEVRFIGFCNQRELSPFYHAADLLVLPSRIGETWGLVVNEALHHGVPCLVSDAVGCAPDLVKPGWTGEVFPSGSSLELAWAIMRAERLVGCSQVRQQCRQWVAKYTIEEAAAGIAEAFSWVTGQKHSDR